MVTIRFALGMQWIPSGLHWVCNGYHQVCIRYAMDTIRFALGMQWLPSGLHWVCNGYHQVCIKYAMVTIRYAMERLPSPMQWLASFSHVTVIIDSYYTNFLPPLFGGTRIDGRKD